MTPRLTRREFQRGVGKCVLIGPFLLIMPARSKPSLPSPPGAPPQTDRSKRFIGVTRVGPDLLSPLNVPEGENWRYGLTFPFQVAPRKVAVWCNIRKERAMGVDFEVGTDVVLFDSLSNVGSGQAVAVSRNHEEPNPNSKPPGAPSVMVRYPVRGGFVPLGAKRADGSPHPHAGTGFGICQVIAWPLGGPKVSEIPDRQGQRPYQGSQRYEFFELKQYVFDGKVFQVTRNERFLFSQLLPGWSLTNPGITSAIPDDDDLLFAMAGGKIGSSAPTFGAEECRRLGLVHDQHNVGCGVVRWRRHKNAWHPISFLPVTDDNSMEPSLVRDIDGALLLSARGGRESTQNDIRVWRSVDRGKTWIRIINVRGAVASSPISINISLDGIPFIAANLYEVLLVPMSSTYGLPPDARLVHLKYLHSVDASDLALTVRTGGWMREKLYLWPLNSDRTGLESPILARDCRNEFGPPPGGSTWNVDHPSAATVQLADGAWHSVMGFRIVERAEITHAIEPTPHTGAYLEEVLSAGKALPSWNF